MENLFLWYSKCSTCKKAKDWLINNNVEFNERSIVDDVPTVYELTEWIRQSGLDIKKFFNTSGLKYKELKLKEKLFNMSDEEKKKLLSTDGKLIKRPIFIYKNKVLVGFKIRDWEKVIKNN